MQHFSLVEKTIFFSLCVLLTGSTLLILSNLNMYLTTEVPVSGGTHTEGVVGAPRFINPLFAVSEADRDLTSVVYAGLMKATPDGQLIPELAEGYEVSPDGLTYTFTLRASATFHDGTPVTADDVEFTILKAQDPAIKSPKRANWDGVKVEKLNDRQIAFALKQPYAPFLENTTLGILPKHMWEHVGAEEFVLSFFNIEPVGAGPYQFQNVSRDSAGIPQTYTLHAFPDYALGAPYIRTLIFSFFPSDTDLIQAYQRGNVDSINSISGDIAESVRHPNDNLVHVPLPRMYAVFFNQSEAPVLLNKEVREALDVAVDKQALVRDVLGKYGVVGTGPLPVEVGSPGVDDDGSNTDMDTENDTTTEHALQAREILSAHGWTFNEENQVWEKIDKKKKQTTILRFSLATGNTPELKRTAEVLRSAWQAMGAQVEVQVYETGDLNQNVIRPRKYDALLFGLVVGRDLDLFAFWHSSQRNDPGLNVAMYANSKADDLLSKARATADYDERIALYQSFEKEVAADSPAIFLYSPEFIYLAPKNIGGMWVDHVVNTSDRFLNVHRWYLNTERVWNFLAGERATPK